MLDKNTKIVFQGLDVIEKHSFHVVKIGEFEVSETSLPLALQLGIIDKYKSDERLPNFELLYHKKVSDNTNLSTRTVVYVFVMREFSDDYETYISGSATFSQRQQRVWKKNEKAV